MTPLQRRVGWTLLGTIGLWWLLLGNIANGLFVFDLGLVAGGLLFLFSFASIAGFAWWASDDGEETLWDATGDSAHRVAAAVGLVDSRVVVEGAVAHDDVVWVCRRRRDGTSEAAHRACPSCGLELVERHAPDAELDGTVAADGGMTVDVLSCPHCTFVTPGQKHDSMGADAALSRFEEAISNMQGAGEASFDQWRRAARDAIGTPPTPADVWDEYTKFVDDDALRRRTTGSLRDGDRRAVDTYRAFAELKQARDTRERLVDVLPNPLDLAAASLFQTDYLQKKERLKRERDAVRQTYAPLRERFFTDYRDTLSSLTRARLNRSWPRQQLSVDEVDRMEADVDALSRLRSESGRLLTGAEHEAISNVTRQYEEARSYLQAASTVRGELGAAKRAVDEFEAEFAPYDDHDTYLEASVETRLRSLCSAASDAVESVQSTLDSTRGPVPADAERHVGDLRSAVARKRATLDEYESLFVDHETAAHPGVFETEHGALNDKQTLAVVRDEPHNLVDASAGTGKTLTLTRRLRYLYETGTPLEDILAITFTGDASAEMEARVAAALGGVDRDRLNISTFHGFARRIVARSIRGGVDGGRLGDGTERFLDRAFEGDDELGRLAPEAMAAFEKHRERLPATDPAALDTWQVEDEFEGADARIRSVFETARNFDRSPDELRTRTDEGDTLEKHAVYAAAALLELYEAFGASRDRPIDHDHTIERATEVVREFSDRYEDRFDHVLVDEFQDVSERQLEFVEALLGPETHLFAVGDDWQSIYGFRGSKPAFFRAFESRYEETSRTTLEINYRCPPAVVEASSALMLDSDEATTKAVRAFSELETTPVLHRLKGAYTDRHGAYIADLVEAAVASPETDYDDVMVLTRNNDGPKETILSHLKESGVPVDGDDEAASVSVQTVHKSKGTEADHVILGHAVDDRRGGMPPKPKRTRGERPAVDATIDHYEEERRLFYVALTRAQTELHIVARSAAVSRYVDSFVDHVDVVDDAATRVEGRVERLTPGVGGKPTTLVVDCGRYDAHLSTWDDALVEDVDVGGIYRFDGLRYEPNTYDQDLTMTEESSVVALD